MLFPSHHLFHTLLLVLIFFRTISQFFYCIVSGQSKSFLIKSSHFFSLQKTFFKFFLSKFSSSFHVTLLAWKISFCLSANHNPEFRCVICTGITLFALVSHLTCTALNQTREIFSRILLLREHYGAPQRKKLDHF